MVVTMVEVIPGGGDPGKHCDPDTAVEQAAGVVKTDLCLSPQSLPWGERSLEAVTLRSDSSHNCGGGHSVGSPREGISGPRCVYIVLTSATLLPSEIWKKTKTLLFRQLWLNESLSPVEKDSKAVPPVSSPPRGPVSLPLEREACPWLLDVRQRSARAALPWPSGTVLGWR